MTFLFFPVWPVIYNVSPTVEIVSRHTLFLRS